MKVLNNSNATVKVAISLWEGSGQSAAYYDVKRGEELPWSRTDARGFLMVISSDTDTNGVYFIKTNERIIIEKDIVKRNGDTIPKLK